MNFFGDRYNSLQCDVIHVAKVGSGYREREPLLQQRRWFDYRQDHPVRLTYLFAHLYFEQVKASYRKFHDEDSATDLLTPWGTADVFDSGCRAAMYLARQGADAIGTPYPFMLSMAFRRCFERGWRLFPRPNQLYGPELILDIQDLWREECRMVLRYPDSAFYQNDRFVGHQDQIAWHDWAVAMLKKRGAPEYSVGNLVFDKGLLPVEIAIEHFGPETVAKARKLFA